MRDHTKKSGLPKPRSRRILRGVVLVIGALILPPLLFAGWLRATTRSNDVEFRSGSLTLRGVLLTPRFREASPAVVFVHGSGQVSRRSSLVHAWVFAANGYAALAYDKRGVGKSDGAPEAWREFNLSDLADDAAAAYRFLQARKEVDPRRVGYFAASQGGWVTSLAARRVDPPAFIVMVSASLSTVAEDRLHGRAAQLRHAGYDEAVVTRGIDLMRLEHEVTRSGQSWEQLRIASEQNSNAAWFRLIQPDPAHPLPTGHPQRRWERTVLDFDPRPSLATLRTPVLWVFGDPALDRFSPVALSLSRVEQGKASGLPYETFQISGVGHTLELEGAHPLRTFLQVRLPLIRKIFQWLETVCQRDAAYGRLERFCTPSPPVLKFWQPPANAAQRPSTGMEAAK